ncbi:MAG: hypothetical protein K0R99_1984 [Microbacterium sp.]|jgi:hypothetical protein|uniref:hypothetical protein n=1 Tax=Microbacterium sp. TaxID=51671 RepID=UPI0026025518|nr:hypothetical protein [Microbacterium sp.]MDF2560538.1 hypothetical protein [Microbacterium sp.]
MANVKDLPPSRLLTAALAHAANRCEREVVGAPVLGWQGRTAGTTVSDSRGDLTWLRVVVARKELARGEWWNGNTDAAELQGIRRPRILAWHEWEEGAACIRAELMDLLPGSACSSTPELREDPPLDEQWWCTLEENLSVLATHPTTRASTTAESIAHRSHVLFGRRFDLSRTVWVTSHGDLHWANLFAPEFALIDWEAWGSAPAGSDIAGLYLHSLLVPEVAAMILERFESVFCSVSGQVGLVFHASRMMARAMAGEYPELIDPVHAAVRRFAPPQE